MKNILKKLSYNPAIIKTIRFLGLREIVRKIYFSFLRPKNNILEVTIAGIQAKYYVRTADELRLAESVSGEWGERPVLEALLQNLQKGDVVYDVGANIGVYSVLIAKAVGESGKVFAFEPEQESIARLKSNAEINGLHNVEVVEKALGDENKQASLIIGKTTGNFSLVASYEKGLGQQQVEVIKADDWISQGKLPIPSAVKIDVEGYEYAVLEGMSKALRDQKCRVLCCEIHPGLFPGKVTEQDVLDLITSLGFSKIEKLARAFSAYHVICTKT